MSNELEVIFKVFGQNEEIKVKAETGSTLEQVLMSMDLIPDDYIITVENTPVPLDSVAGSREYLMYKVPSGG